jgi:hypothetical protein
MSVALRSEDYVEVRVVRSGRVVYEFAGRTNTLYSYFIEHYRSEVTSNTDVNSILPLSKLTLHGSLLESRGGVSLTPDDITVDETAMTISLVKLVTITAAGDVSRVRLNAVLGSYVLCYIENTIPYINVRVGDVVYVRYIGKLYLTLSNPGGILSDAVIDYTEFIKRLYYRLKGTETRSLRIAKVEYVDDAGNVVLSVNTNNDNTNYVVRAPLTMVSQTVKVKTVRLCDSSGTALMRFTKPEPAILPATSAIKTEVAIQ